MKCPHCQNEIEVRINKAPQQQADKAGFGKSSSNGSGDVGELLNECAGQPMTPWEETFIAETEERYGKYKDRIKMSDKQLNILRKIASGQGGRQREDEF